MRRESPGFRRAVILAAILLAAAAAAMLSNGCGRSDGRPRVEPGSLCATCGMEIRDLRFACVIVPARGSSARAYDSIECALASGARGAGARVYLADFATGSLHAADSLWVVRASIPSPMGGGLAAFRSRERAERIARERNGRTAPFARIASIMPVAPLLTTASPIDLAPEGPR